MIQELNLACLYQTCPCVQPLDRGTMSGEHVEGLIHGPVPLIRSVVCGHGG